MSILDAEQSARYIDSLVASVQALEADLAATRAKLREAEAGREGRRRMPMPTTGPSTLKTNVSWEDQQSAVYTVEAMKKEIELLLTPKQDYLATELRQAQARSCSRCDHLFYAPTGWRGGVCSDCDPKAWGGDAVSDRQQDTPEAVERLRAGLRAAHPAVYIGTDLADEIDAALRAYAQLLRRVERVRDWTYIGPLGSDYIDASPTSEMQLRSEVRALLDGEPGAQP